MLRSSCNLTGDFSNFSHWWEVVIKTQRSSSMFREADGHARAMPRSKQMVTCCRPATTKPCTEKNKTLWLIPNHCLPDNSTGCQVHVFNSRVKQPAWVPLLCLAKWGSPLRRRYLFLSITSTRCAVTGRYTHWMICPLVCGQKKNWQNKNSGKKRGRVVRCQRLRWVETPRVHIWHDLFEFSKWKEHIMGFSSVLSTEIEVCYLWSYQQCDQHTV